jgi:hypothetical protein
MQVMADQAMREFENRALQHLSTYFPDQCQALGEETTRGAIRYGLKRARSYGFEYEHEVGWYIDLMFMFGSEFDRDPKILWAADILNDPELFLPGMKVDALLEAACEHEHQVTGLVPTESVAYGESGVEKTMQGVARRVA